MLTLPLGLYPEGWLIIGYIAGLFVRFNDICKRVMVLVPGVGWWVKNFDVEPRGEQKVLSNSPSVPLGVCYDWSHQPIAMEWDTWGGDRWYSDWGPQNNNTGLPCFCNCHKHYVLNTQPWTFSYVLSHCHTKRRTGACPSFGMTPVNFFSKRSVKKQH